LELVFLGGADVAMACHVLDFDKLENLASKEYLSKHFILTPNFRTSGLVDILVQKKLLNEEVSPQIFS